MPNAIDQLTGGYLFARHVVERLRAQGDTIDVVELRGRFPAADGIARESAAEALSALPDGAAAVIDGLALAAFEPCLKREARRLHFIGWVHHPLAEETGLSAAEAARFREIEARLLPLLAGVLCPSRSTAEAVIGAGVSRARIGVAAPGTAKPATRRTRGRQHGAVRLLCVASVTPRKGQLVLVEALASLKRPDWRLLLIGSPTRDPAYAAAVSRAIAANGLEGRVTLGGEIPSERLGAAYEEADLFVLPSFHEGYGMALAEALAHGLAVVSTRAGAIPEIVPLSAALLVPPGDGAALEEALWRLLDDRDYLAALGEGALRAGAALPDWAEAASRWRAEALRLLA